MLVKGARLGLICDLQRNEYSHIPFELVDVLEQLKNRKISDVIELYSKEEKETVLEYLDWMVKNDWGMFTNNLEDIQKFIPINLEINSPFSVSNIILHINDSSKKHIDKLITEINSLNIPHCEIFIENMSNVSEIIKKLDSSVLRSIQLNFINPTDNCDVYEYEELCKLNYRISSIIVFNSKEEFRKELIFSEMIPLIFTSQKFNTKGCGIVQKEYFNSNVKNFVESMEHNSCLNRKMSVDFNGEIKNCPSMTENYGILMILN